MQHLIPLDKSFLKSASRTMTAITADDYRLHADKMMQHQRADENGMTPKERMEKFYFSHMRPEQKRKLPYDPRPTDVVIVGPAKAGTTWMQHILHQIRTKGDESFEDIYKITWLLPFKQVKYEFDLNADQVANPRVYKCHAAYEIAPRVDGMKYIFITRDPYDCYWSYTKYMYRFFGSDEDLSEDQALDIFHIEAKFGHDYFANVCSWFEHRDDPDVLWIHYEDLKRDLQFCIGKIAEFLEIKLNEEELTRIHSLCTFEYMSKNHTKFSGDPIMEAFAKASKAESWRVKSSMVRKDGGKAGQGLKHMGPRLKKAITERWAETIGKQLGYSSYGELFEDASFLKKYAA